MPVTQVDRDRIDRNQATASSVAKICRLLIAERTREDAGMYREDNSSSCDLSLDLRDWLTSVLPTANEEEVEILWEQFEMVIEALMGRE
jgi:hypothetical protein